MPTVHYYVYDKREDVEFGGEHTDLYLVHEFRNKDFSNVVHPKKVPDDKMPTQFEVGDLIEAGEYLAGSKLGRVETERAPADLQEKVEEIYAKQHQQVRDYAEQLGVDVDDLPDHLKKPGKDIPQRYYFINRREEDQYVLETLQNTTLNSWRGRRTVSVNAIPSRFDVGDVLLSPDGSPWSLDDAAIIEPASSGTTEAIRDVFTEFETRVRKHATEFDVSVDDRPKSLEDGDTILLAGPKDAWESPPEEKYLYVTPEGFYSDGETMDLLFDWLVNCPESTLESGMAFTFVEIDDEYVDGLRYDHARSQEVCNKPALVHLHSADLSDYVSGIDSIDGLEWPLYVLIDGFDDGQYYSSLYDRGGSEDSKWPELRQLISGSTRQPQHVPKEWPYPHGGAPVPISELYLDKDDHPEAPVAVVSRESEPIHDQSRRNR